MNWFPVFFLYLVLWQWKNEINSCLHFFIGYSGNGKMKWFHVCIFFIYLVFWQWKNEMTSCLHFYIGYSSNGKTKWFHACIFYIVYSGNEKMKWFHVCIFYYLVFRQWKNRMTTHLHFYIWHFGNGKTIKFLSLCLALKNFYFFFNYLLLDNSPLSGLHFILLLGRFFPSLKTELSIKIFLLLDSCEFRWITIKWPLHLPVECPRFLPFNVIEVVVLIHEFSREMFFASSCWISHDFFHLIRDWECCGLLKFLSFKGRLICCLFSHDFCHLICDPDVVEQPRFCVLNADWVLLKLLMILAIWIINRLAQMTMVWYFKNWLSCCWNW